MQTRNRWAIAAAAVVMQLCLGAVYGWSVFVKPLQAYGNWSLKEVTFTFQLALAVTGFGTVLGGLWQDRVGPRVVASVAGMLFGAGYLVSGWAMSQHSLMGLYAGYGVLGGLGMGMGYICPVALMTKWFPDRRGLMTGVAVMGYGAGAVIMSLIAPRQIISSGLSATFTGFGVAYLILVTLAAQFYATPPQGWKPEGWVPRTAVSKAAGTYQFSVSEAMSTWQFWLLLFMLFLNVSAGIMIISQASPMAQQLAHLSAVNAASLVLTISIFNALGRVFWAWVSDSIGRARVYMLLYGIQAVVFFLLPSADSATAFICAGAIIGLCYGGGFGVMPSFTADFFGAKNMGGIYGWILLAWGLGAIPSPLLIAQVRQTTGTYTGALQIIAIVMLLSIGLPLLARRPAKQENTAAAAVSA
jgi:OFA family oxalate/formate antiporter-like MFS transporter